MTAPASPSRTYECVPCEQTYFAGAKSGPGPFVCDFCQRELTLRPDGAEPYQGGASPKGRTCLPENGMAAEQQTATLPTLFDYLAAAEQAAPVQEAQ